MGKCAVPDDCNCVERSWLRFIHTSQKNHKFQTFRQPLTAFISRLRSPAYLSRCTRHPEPWKDRTLTTIVYWKPTHTVRYLDFQSHHPIAHKIAVIRILNHRTKNPPTPTAAAEGERRVAQALKLYGYPTKLIEQQTYHSPPLSQDTTPPNAYVTIPYVKNTSESIRRIIVPLCIRTFFQPTNTLRQVLVRPKGSVPKENWSWVIYQIPCNRYPQTYIGH